MKIKNIILIIAVVLLAGGVWVLLPKQSHRPVSGEHAHKDIYYCPMHPQITSDKPGTCPICFMKLVKKETQAPPSSSEQKSQTTSMGHSTVSIDPKKQQLIGVKTRAVEKQMLTKTIRAYGYVAHDLELYEAQLDYIEAWREFYSFLARRPVKDEFRVDWREYYKRDAAENRWRSDEKRKAQEKLIKAEYELRHMGINDAQLMQLREIKYGQPWVQPELLFFEQGHPQWVYAEIFESDLGYVDVGQQAIVTIVAYGEKTEGIVRNVSQIVDPETRTTKVRVELPEYPSELKVNMSVDVEFPVEFDTLLVVPKEAIMDTGKSKIVFVKTDETHFEPRDVQTGLEGDGVVAVKAGLTEGEQVVVSGNFLIDSESQIKAALEGFLTTTTETPNPLGHSAHGGQK